MLEKKLDTHYVTGFDSFTDLQAAVSKFNDPNQAADVFISTFKDVEQGLVFHGACNHGIVFEYPSNLGTLRKAIQTLRYSGQMKRDHWINFHQVGTMDELKAQGMYIRAAKHILSNKDYCSYLDDEHRAIRAYYDLAVSMGDSSSRYPRNRVLLDKLETEEVRREGKHTNFHKKRAKLTFTQVSSTTPSVNGWPRTLELQTCSKPTPWRESQRVGNPPLI
jgi:hypothetical protein